MFMVCNGRNVAARSIRIIAVAARPDLFSVCEIHRLPHFTDSPETARPYPHVTSRPWHLAKDTCKYFS